MNLLGQPNASGTANNAVLRAVEPDANLRGRELVFNPQLSETFVFDYFPQALTHSQSFRVTLLPVAFCILAIVQGDGFFRVWVRYLYMADAEIPILAAKTWAAIPCSSRKFLSRMTNLPIDTA
jgi:hypothetical protein